MNARAAAPFASQDADAPAVSPTPGAVALQALLDQAEAHLVSDPAWALDLASRARQLARDGAQVHQVLALTLMGYAQYFLDRVLSAHELFSEAARLAQPLPLDPAHPRIRNGQALCFMRRGDIGQSLECHMQALGMAQELGDDRARARALNNIGVLLMGLREYEEAARYAEDALSIAAEGDMEEFRHAAAINLAFCLQELGRVAEALAVNQHTFATAQHARSRELKAVLNSNMSLNLLALGDLEGALRHSDDAQREMDAITEPENVCGMLTVRGRILAALNRPEEARVNLEQALEGAQRRELARSESEACWELAGLAAQRGDFREAFGHLKRRDAVERRVTRELVERRTQRMTAQLQLERVEQRVRETEQRRQELQDANKALLITQQSLQYYVCHDALTGLKNRPAFENDLQVALGALAGPRTGQQVSLIFIDLDHFKVVNDTLGHPIGDELLRQVARRLTAALPPGGIVARQGGDEFTVLVTHAPGDPDGLSVAEGLQAALSEPFELAGNAMVVTTSIGVAVAPQDGMDVVTLYKNADLAMYQAKENRNDLQCFAPALSTAAHERLTLLQELRSACQHGEFQLHYQPIVDARTLSPVKLEALLRWQHPERGVQTAEHFIRVIEHSELATGVLNWTLRAALTDLIAWRSRWPTLQVSVNVTPRDLARAELPALITALLSELGLPASALELEMTEYAALSDVSWRPYAALLDEGLSIAIDDFGTGYSSMSRLGHAPTRTLKIDRSLIQRLSPAPEGADRSGQIVRTLITFAHTYGLTTVAEGVEEDWQLELLSSWYCDLIQGYLIARPMPAAQVSDYLNDMQDA